jgi:hypothetical protein
MNPNTITIVRILAYVALFSGLHSFANWARQFGKEGMARLRAMNAREARKISS